MQNVSNWSLDVLGVDPDDPLYDEIVHVLGRMWLSFQFDPADPAVQERARVIAAKRQQDKIEDRKLERQAKPSGRRPHVVYYARIGQYVKIGTTVNVRQRMKGYPPDAVLLATEPGHYDVEHERHRQFAADLIERNEWFRPSADLIAHINSLRDEPLTAADLAA